MAFRALRTALYSALLVFSIILLGVSSSRVRFTNRALGFRPFYNKIVVELIATSILALIWSIVLIFSICLAVGGCMTFLTELIGLFILWVMFLVGAAIATRQFQALGFCRAFSLQCRLLTAIVSWSWICWATTTFLIIAAIAAMIMGKHGILSALHGSGTRRGRDYRHKEAPPGDTTATGPAAAETTGRNNQHGNTMVPGTNTATGNAPAYDTHGDMRGVDTAPTGVTGGGAYGDQRV